MTLRISVPLMMLILLTGCATDPSLTVTHRVPRGGTVAVVMLQDCNIPHQPDCDGSGAKAGSIFANVLAQRPGLHTASLPRPVGPKAPLSDTAAIAYAKAKGYRYVINGEVQDYYGGHMSLRSNRANVSLRVLSTSSGLALATYSYQETSKAHLTTPDEMLEDMAKQLAAAIMVEPKSRHQGNFLFYKDNNSG